MASHTRSGLLGEIEAGVLDDTVPLSSLLQKCIVLGGQAESQKMREWARKELNGYIGTDTVPDYRHIPAALIAVITNNAGYNPMTQRIRPSTFPDQIRDMLAEEVDIEVAILGGGIGELEALASRETDDVKLAPSWSGFAVDMLNKYNIAPNSRVDAVYWPVSIASIKGLLIRVRTALADLVAELIALTPQEQEVPDKAAADQAIRFVVTGDQNTINVSQHSTSDDGTSVSISTPDAGPVTVSGTHGTAIGSQTASGANSSVMGTQTQGDQSAIAGQNLTSNSGREQSSEEGWWARLRKRGMIVAFATVMGALATIAAAIVAVITFFA